mgnify:CR=1 FL=1
MYLVVAMDLYSRRIVVWHNDRRITVELMGQNMIKALNLRQPKAGLVFHSDRGPQYTTRWHRG